MHIPILTYHALNAPGWTYDSNDHVAFAEDLALLRRQGYRTVSLSRIADALIQGTFDSLAEQRVAGVSFDDGTDHDWVDFSYPGWGSLRAMATILREDGAGLALDGADASGTSFVIVSPDARSQLDRACSAGRGQWQENWWRTANESGVLEIASHSWDHLHEALDRVAHSGNARGNFHSIDSREDADAQILRAENYLIEHLGQSSGLFAYPYGHVAQYLLDFYFPRGIAPIKAAFASSGGHCTQASNRWSIPRWVCQQHWRSSEELEQLLQSDH